MEDLVNIDITDDGHSQYYNSINKQQYIYGIYSVRIWYINISFKFVPLTFLFSLNTSPPTTHHTLLIMMNKCSRLSQKQ